MKPIKRIEIVVGSVSSKKVVALLEEKGIEEYTLVRNVLGKGTRGEQDGEGLHDAFLNNYILIGCSEDEFERIKEPIRQLLGQIGGACMVSDALWLQH